MKSRSGIYIGWVGKDNLGDEAMWQVCQSTFSQLQWILWDELRYEFSASRYLGHVRRDQHYILNALVKELRTRNKLRMFAHKLAHSWKTHGAHEIGLLGGGTLINRDDPWLADYKTISRRTRRPVCVFGSGVANPELWTSEPGWVDKRKEWVSLLSDLPVIGVRGPLSKALLEDAGAKGVVVSGDPAVALHVPLARDGQLEANSHPVRLGMNCGCHWRMWGKASSVFEVQSQVVRDLKEKGFDVELFAVIPADVECCELVARQAGMDSSKVKICTSPADFFRMVGTYQLVVALKLHAGILAAAANVPFLMLEYQPKCLDFVMSLGWECFTIRTSHLTRDILSDMIFQMAGNLPELRIELCRAMCALASQFQAYCREIEPILQPA